ncbi:MAG: TlpA family protein disulfide reductase [Acidobacteria bacterium]|nr:TlpA family protein disulfide reductase [Acidobacteriota bacterium]
MNRFAVALIFSAAPVLAGIVQDVRAAAVTNKDFALAEKLLQQAKANAGQTPEWLAAHSWLGRAALFAKMLDKADAYAAETRRMALAELKKRPLDADADLPIALGASIEVQGQVLAERGRRSEAVDFLKQELKTYHGTSIRTRIQKNVHLLSLTGQEAPALDLQAWLGPKPAPVASFKGKPVLLFFWAHWCGDCKQQEPVLARLKKEHEAKGLTILGPTQHYGYVAGGQEATAGTETPYIDQIRRQHYSDLLDVSAPLSQENFRMFGASTTPTLVLIDRKGKVSMYHPGKMTHEELSAEIAKVL